MQRRGLVPAETCRAWAAARLESGVRFLVPEIIDYELRRELIRLNHTAAIARLDEFIHTSDRLIRITPQTLKLAANLWADMRTRGLPTSSAESLDIDVILSAQVLSADYPPEQFVVATSNSNHISRMVRSAPWQDIL
jgi:hypothetical protein